MENLEINLKKMFEWSFKKYKASDVAYLFTNEEFCFSILCLGGC